jgi:hypothetical protein
MAKRVSKKTNHSATKLKTLGSRKAEVKVMSASEWLKRKEAAPRQRRKAPEQELQIECVRWFDSTFPKYVDLLFHVPNGGLRGWKTAKDFKDMGTRKGVPDFFFLWNGVFYPIEMKSEVGHLSAEQKSLHLTWKNEGKLKGEIPVLKRLESFKACILGIMNNENATI